MKSLQKSYKEIVLLNNRWETIPFDIVAMIANYLEFKDRFAFFRIHPRLYFWARKNRFHFGHWYDSKLPYDAQRQAVVQYVMLMMKSHEIDIYPARLRDRTVYIRYNAKTEKFRLEMVTNQKSCVLYRLRNDLIPVTRIITLFEGHLIDMFKSFIY